MALHYVMLFTRKRWFMFWCLSSKLNYLYTHTQHNISYNSGRRLAPLDAWYWTWYRN